MKSRSFLFGIGMMVIVPYSTSGQHPFNKDLYAPIPLQHYTPPKDTLNKENKLEMFNMIEKKFDTLTFGASEIGQAGENENQVWSFTNLQAADQLPGFGTYPITSIVKLYLTFYNPSTGANSYVTGSGALISPGFVITAGHCVKSKFDSSYAVSGIVIPKYNLGSKPFGQVTTTNWYSFTQWTENGNLDYDMAILRLSSPIGHSTGWLGWGYHSDDSFFTNPGNTFFSFGYPGGYDIFGNPVLEQGERMYYMTGFMDSWQSVNTVCHNNVGYSGQSGSALYYQNASDSVKVYGVLSHGNVSPPYYTCHCRMDSGMFSYFNTIISSTAGTESFHSTREIKVYPNPSSAKFSIDFREVTFKHLSLKVFNNTGQLVLETLVPQNDPITIIDLTPFPSGVYSITAMVDGKMITGKICKTE